jgi:hypothetical protein
MCRKIVSPLQRAKESFLSPAKAGSQFKAIHCPTLESVGYGSYAGFSGGPKLNARHQPLQLREQRGADGDFEDVREDERTDAAEPGGFRAGEGGEP